MGFSGDGGLANKQLNTPISISLTPDEKLAYLISAIFEFVRLIWSLESFAQSQETVREETHRKQACHCTTLISPRSAIMDNFGNLFILERNGNALRVVRKDGKIYTLRTGKSQPGRSGFKIDL